MRNFGFIGCLLLSLTLSAADVFVDSGGSDAGGDGSSTAPFQTIQKGVNAANSGDTIRIAAGTYIEQIILIKNVNLVGGGVGVSVVRSPAVMAANIPNNVTPASPKNAILTVLAATVSVTQLTFTGPGATNCGSIQYGVFVGGGGVLTMTACRVTSIRDEPLTGCQSGRAISVGSTELGQAGTAIIDSCQIDDYQKSGVAVEGVNSRLSLQNSTVTGIGPTTALAQNGVLSADGASSTIGNNTISNNSYTPGPTNSVGILAIGDTSNIALSGNTFSGNDTNIVGIPITITSFPSATPNPAKPGDDVKLTMAASVSGGQTLTYEWDFGDGTKLGGDTVNHTWVAEGFYQVVVTIRASAGASLKSFVNVRVAIPHVEGTFEVLNITKKSIRGKNPTLAKDSTQIRGTLDLPIDATTVDSTLRFSFGTLITDFEINAKGKSAKRPEKSTFNIKAKYKKKVLTTRTVQFQAKIVGDLLKVLIECGRPAGTSGAAVVPIRVIYKGVLYGADAVFTIKGTAKGFSGK